MAEIDTIIFDLGNVLISWDPKNLYDKMFEDQNECDYFLNNVCTMEWNHSLDGGRSWDKAIEEKVGEYPQYQNEIQAYQQRWAEMLNGEIPGTAQLLEDIYKRRQHNLYALTNWSNETWPIALKQFGFLSYFSGIVVSGHEGMCKPEEPIFELICDRYKVKPDTALFIDDSIANIETAIDLGFVTHHFQNAKKLGNTLISLEVL